MTTPTPTDPLHTAAVEAAQSVLYWRAVADSHRRGSLERLRALRIARYSEGIVVNHAIRAETEARRRGASK